MTPVAQLAAIKARTERLIGEDALLARLATGKPLRIKLGVDPTRPDLTFGHMVCLNKLRELQDLGHQAVLLIGDFTTRVGDPTGRSSTRPVLTPEEISANAKTYLEQAYRILDPARTEVVRNGDWFGRMTFLEAIQLCRHMTVQQMLARDDFSKRHSEGTPISLVEFLYPLLQGHDSVEVRADLEMGGSDQLFNMLVGRDLQLAAGQPPQAVLTMPLLVGLDGVQKMSKSLGNYIAFNDSAKDIFGKVMSIPDATMWTYWRLLMGSDEADIARRQAAHPMEMKKQLASALTAKFHGDEAGQYERAQFENVFSKGLVRDDMPAFAWGALVSADTDALVVDVLAATGLFPSKKEIIRLIEGGAVKVGDDKVADRSHRIARPSAELVIQAGKRTFIKLTS